MNHNLLTAAEKLGLPTSPPYLSIPFISNGSQAFLTGVSFASGGAGVLDSTNPVSHLQLSIFIPLLDYPFFHK